MDDTFRSNRIDFSNMREVFSEAQHIHNDWCNTPRYCVFPLRIGSQEMRGDVKVRQKDG